MIDPSYITELKHVIRNDIMFKITDNEQLITAVLSDKCMPYWIKCFTTPLISADNNDVIEKLGDAVLELCLIDKVVIDNPHTTPALINDSIAYYGNNKFLHQLFMGLPPTSVPNKRLEDFLRVDYNLVVFEHLPVSIIADLYESFLGTIKIVVSIVANGRLGYEYANEWFLYTLRMNNMDKLVDTKGNSVTILKQIFSRFADVGKFGPKISGKPTVVNLSDSNLTVVGLYYYLDHDSIKKLIAMGTRLPQNTDKLVLIPPNYIQPMGINTPNKLVIGLDKKRAGENAAEQALIFLKSYGITPEWATSKKNDELLSHFSAEDGQKFINKIKSMGYVDFDIKALDGKYGLEGMNIMQLFGIKLHPDGRRELQLLLSIPGGGNKFILKQQIVNKFITA